MCLLSICVKLNLTFIFFFYDNHCIILLKVIFTHLLNNLLNNLTILKEQSFIKHYCSSNYGIS